MHWRVLFFLQENHESNIWREDFKFKSKNTPPQCKHMEALEKEFLDVIQNIKFRFVKDTFQKKLIEDIPKLKLFPNIFCLSRQNK